MIYKKACATVMSVAVLLSLVLPMTVSAVAVSSAATLSDTTTETMQQVVSMLGIMTGDAQGDLNLTKNVTRAEFAKILVAASNDKDRISAVSNVSPFRDVSYTHWAAGYIRMAVQNGWFSGYLDGSFRPSNTIRLEEAVSATLKLLGYTASDFVGSYPYAQLSMYESLGLSKNLSVKQGQSMTREDCMILIYNALNAETKSGAIYAVSLGYSVNAEKEIDFNKLMSDTLEGPYIVLDNSWQTTIPFDVSEAVVYRNGYNSSDEFITNYDVLYYSKGLKRIWVYSNRVTGMYESALPSTVSPTSVTISGKSYSISSQEAVYDVSSLGHFRIGDSITLILGMDGGIVGVVSADTVSTTVYGVITDIAKNNYKDSSGNAYTSMSVTITDTAGETRTYAVSSISASEDSLVQVYMSNGKTVITTLSEKYLTGVVNSTATITAGYQLAKDAKILDISDAGILSVYPQRIAGLDLTSTNVRFYALNEDNHITHLILNNAIRDAYKFGIILSKTVNSGNMSISSSYTCDFSGVQTTYSSNTSAYAVEIGPCMVSANGNSILSMANLNQATISSIAGSETQTSDGLHRLWDDVIVYEYKDSAYYLTSLSLVSNLNEYTLKAYYDKDESDGGRIRIIIATAK